jgi:hypothetical protein
MTVDPQTHARPAAFVPLRGREATAPPAERAAREQSPERRMLIAGPMVALFAILAAVLTTHAAGLPLRDPDHVAGRRLILVFVMVAALVGLDLLVRATRRSPRAWPTPASIAAVRRERWTLPRAVAVFSALISFYVTYLAYRNLKSVVPLLRPDDLFDDQLASLDRTLFDGHDPATLLHDVLGTGVQTHLLSDTYMLFFVFIPGTLAFALVFSRNLQAGLFYVTAQSINWVLGAASYFLFPSLGPVYAEPSVFSSLPPSGVTHLQTILFDQRLHFLQDPATGSAQSIAAFTSLHVSIFFTAAMVAHLLGIKRPLRIGAWVLLALTTTATIYLGWHYVIDDLGGLVVGAMAILLARGLTGVDLRTAGRPSARGAAPA